MRPVCSIVTTGTNGAKTRLTSDNSISVNAIFIFPHPDNPTGPFFVGTSDLDTTTYAGVINVMPGTTDSFSWPQSQTGNNQLHPSDYYVAGQTTGDKFLITYWIA